MSDVMNADRYAAGIATAYGAAVQGGYTGTYAQFCAQQAQFAENAQAVEEAKQEVLSTVQTFENTTVPAAITQVQEEGTAQIQVVQDATAQQITALQEEGLRQQAAVVEAAADQVEAARIQAQRSENAADAAEGYRDETQGLKNTFENTTVPAAVQTVQNAGAAQVQAVEQAGSDQVDAVELAGSTQVGNVNTAGTTQVGNVNQAGTTQIAAVAAEGAAQVQAVEDKGDEVIASIPTEYTQLSEDVDTLKKNKAPVIVEEASGQLVSIVDGADGMLVKKLLVNVDPVQDLHGQDAPYPAGGGVNKFDGTTWNTYIPLHLNVGDKLIAQCNVDADHTNAYFVVRTYDSNKTFLQSFTTTQGTTTRYNNVTITSEAEYIQAQTSTPELFSNIIIAVGDYQLPMAYSPYSNICPITGWTGCEVTRTGKNLFDPNVFLTATGWSEADGVYSGNCQNIQFSTIGYLLELPNLTEQVTVSFNGYVDYEDSRAGYFRIYYADGTTSLLEFKDKTWKNYSLTSTSGKTVVGIGFTMSNSRNVSIKDFQVEIGSTATDYEPYQGETLDITFPNEAGTVYGALVDALIAKLAVNRDVVDLGTLQWSKTNTASGHWRFYATLNSQKLPSVLLCSQYQQVGASAQYMGTQGIANQSSGNNVLIMVCDERYSDVAAFQTAMSGVQLVYELATPQTYQLTAQQMTTLLGSNNIWADTGDVEVEYCADTKLYIERLTQPTEDDMTANANIAANRFFMIGNNLYYSTSAIAAGATIIPGTNCTAISLADALNQLNT